MGLIKVADQLANTGLGHWLFTSQQMQTDYSSLLWIWVILTRPWPFSVLVS